MWACGALVLSLLKLVSGLTDNEKACLAEHTGALDNDFLVGTWYEVYRFAYWLNLPASSTCIETKITKPTEADIAEYVAAHGNGEPFQLDSTAVLYGLYNGYFTGMLTRNTEGKIYAWDPKSVFFHAKFDDRVYKKVNAEYMVYNTCAVPSTKSLLSRRRNQTEAELQAVIATIEDVKRLETQRYCSPK